MLSATRLCVLAVCLAGFAADCFAQPLSLVERYRRARLGVVVDNILQTLPPTLPFRGPVHIETPADTLISWIDRWRKKQEAPVVEAPKQPLEEGVRWKLYSRLERPVFERAFKQTLWSFLGTTRYQTPVDTTNTARIRARLQAAFGAPTRTVIELDTTKRLAPGDYIQFEYWFVLNDTIPLKVVDVNGPLNRGVIVASDERYRDTLFKIRQAFLEEVVMDAEEEPFTDYYFHYETRQWYRAGYTGERYFLERIRPPNRAAGRPQLQTPDG